MAKPHPFLDPARFWLNSVYLLILCIAGGAILELLKDLIPSNTALSMGSASAVCIVFSFGIWLGCRRDFLKWRESQLVTRIFVPTKRALPAEGLIALCGPTASEFRSTNPAFAAACHHRPKLKHLWLITSMAGEEKARWVNEQAAGWGVKTHPPVVLGDTLEIEIIKLKIEETRREAIEGFRIREEELICDFTGMLKPVTAGMILACAPGKRRLQYLQGQYSADGVLLRGQECIPTEIEIRYEIEAE